MKLKIVTRSAIALVMLAGYSVPASAIYCSNCATVVQAGQSYVQEVQSVVNQVTGLEHQVQTINNQLMNLKTLNVHNWGNVQAQINQLGNIARQGDALAYSMSDVSEQWATRFKGYDHWAQGGNSSETMSEQYRLLADTMRDTAKSSLEVASAMSSVQIEDEQTISQLQQNSSSATGALQAVQSGNEIAAQTTRQLQKIQTLMQADIQMTSTKMAAETEKSEQQRAAADATITEPKTNTENGIDWSKPWG